MSKFNDPYHVGSVRPYEASSLFGAQSRRLISASTALRKRLTEWMVLHVLSRTSRSASSLSSRR